MYRHSAESIKESSRKMFVSLEEKTKYNSYENTLRKKDDSYSKEEVDNKIKELSDNTYGDVEGNYISESNTIDGHVKDLEIIGNTIQNTEDLSDIKSVGELQEDGTYKMSILSHGKNLFNGESVLPLFYKDKDDILSYGAVDDTRSWTYNNSQYKFNLRNGTYRLTLEILKPPSSIYAQLMLYTEKSSTSLVSLNNTHLTTHTSISKTFTINDDNNVGILLKIYDGKFRIQIEEGDVNTSYEPYKESRVDISLPCQLEKVGDISDRLYYDEEEKAWCIEKNVVRVNEFNLIAADGVLANVKRGYADLNFYCKNKYAISNILLYNENYTEDSEHFYIQSDKLNRIWFFVNNTKVDNMSGDTVLQRFTNWLNENVEVYLNTSTPQKIILPLSTQIQLNSYANKTHIYTVSGEVEGTIKATLPKSLGSSVQSLNNKTDMMIDRIENIETLKEGQNISYESDKGFVVCENTNNGQIDNIKIEGRTLVNTLLEHTKVTNDFSNHYPNWGIINISKSGTLFKENTVYTFIVNITKNTTGSSIRDAIWFGDVTGRQISYTDDIIRIPCDVSQKVFTIKTLSSFVDKKHPFSYQFNKNISTGIVEFEVLVLEGDHTQNPPSYFEGLMSVDNDNDTIEVNSIKSDGNLYSYNEHSSGYNGYLCSYEEIETDCIKVIANNPESRGCCFIYIETEEDDLYLSISIEGNGSITKKLKDNTYITNYTGNNSNVKFLLEKGRHYKIELNAGSSYDQEVIYRNITISKYGYIDYRSKIKHTKSLLYYNDLGELVPVPELHEWDSIEKHSDGKYYYHKRSEKIVLNGSENWYLNIESVTESNTLAFYIPTNPKAKNLLGIICDLFHTDINIFKMDYECIRISSDQSASIYIRINKSRLSSENVEGFKAWLSSNNVTVVYELAEEQVYECVNLNLDTYDNETMVMVNSGAISPKISFNVSSHIGNTVSILRERIKAVEEEYINYKLTQDKLLLNTLYSSDRGSYSVSTLSTDYEYQELEEVDYELFEITKSVIEVGLDNYNTTEMEELIDFYTIIGKFNYDMADILFELIDNQINPPVIEIPEEEFIDSETIEEEIITEI